MKILNTKDENFNQEFSELLKRGAMDIDSVSLRVKNILDEIKKEGIKHL